MALLEQMAEYIADRLQLTVGEQVFYYEMPDEPMVCVGILEIPTTLGSIAQIDASSHRIKLLVRAESNTAANELASRCYRALKSDETAVETTDTGFIRLPDESYVYVYLRGEPVWDSVDQQKRKTFAFEATITSQKL